MTLEQLKHANRAYAEAAIMREFLARLDVQDGPRGVFLRCVGIVAEAGFVGIPVSEDGASFAHNPPIPDLATLANEFVAEARKILTRHARVADERFAAINRG